MFNSQRLKTSYMPVYLGDSYKLAAVKVYPTGKAPFYVENLDPSTKKRFSNVNFLAYVENVFFEKYGYRGLL